MINEKFKTIFIHPPKTGGWTVCEYFQGDVIEIEKNEKTFKAVRPRHFPMNFYKDLDLNKYFIFANTRNPWERMVSAYFFFKKDPTLKTRLENENLKIDFSKFSFSDYVNLTYENFLTKKISFKKDDKNEKWFFLDCVIDWISIDNKIYVDYICELNTLNEDFQLIKELLGFSEDLPHMNKTIHKDYKKYYSTDLIEKIEKIFQKDIDYFNYKFEEKNPDFCKILNREKINKIRKKQFLI